MGFQVVAANYDSPIPRSTEMGDSLFNSQSDCVGIDWNQAVQEEYLTQVFPKYSGEVKFSENPWISPIDATILHAMIRHHQPRKIVEVGSGYSTGVVAAAITMSGSGGSEVVAIDPQPRTTLLEDTPGLSRIIREPIQKVAFGEITDCDLLFIDSSHIVKMGGDVNYEILEIVPRLKVGAIIHWHDILLPGEYWKDWVTLDHNFRTKQYLLQAFLQFNHDFEIIWSSQYMSVNSPEAVRSTFPEFAPTESRISSFWIRRIH